MALTKIDDRGLTTPIDLLDSEKIRFGTGNDLEIYHDGSNGWLKNGTNTLILASNLLELKNNAGDETYLKGTANGAVQLYYDSGTYSSPKLETTASGAKITGALQTTGNVDVNGGSINLGVIDTSSGHINAAEVMTFNIDTDNDDTTRYFAFYNNGAGGSGTELFRIQEDGKVGIGTVSPNNTLDVNGGIVCSPNTDGKDTFELSTHAVNEGRLSIKNVDTTTVQIRAGGDTYFNGGNVGIGTTSPDKSLTIGGSNPVIKLNDGNGRILELRGGSTTHNPGLVTGYASGLYLGSNGTESVVVGEEHLTITDGNLVVASGHGIDFSLSPDIATGETTTSQILDDYEEGNFNVNYKTGAANSNTLSAAAYTTTGGLYTKVGNIVHFQIRLKCTSATTVGGQIVIEGLPFTQISSNITSGAYVVCPEMLGSSNDTRLLIDGTVIKFQTLAGGVLGSSAGGLDFTGEFHCAGTYIAT